MRCQYCYNSNIVLSKDGNYEIKDLFTFLEKRIGLLDAVVLSGGEATMHNLEPICKKIKAMGFKIKLDTNGLNTKLIKTLIDKNYIDYIALGFKATKEKFQDITKTNQYNKFLDTLEFLIEKNFDFEVRTTLHEELLDENDINKIVDTLISKGYKNSLYIQNFLNVENFANLKESKKVLNKDLLSKNLNIIWRN
jgi:pyruvate formate lyase activating enzyme